MCCTSAYFSHFGKVTIANQLVTCPGATWWSQSLRSDKLHGLNVQDERDYKINGHMTQLLKYLLATIRNVQRTLTHHLVIKTYSKQE